MSGLSPLTREALKAKREEIDKKHSISVRMNLFSSGAINKIPALFCVADLNGFFVDVNDKWTEVLGWTKNELLSKKFIEFVHPEDLISTEREYQNIVKSGNEVIGFVNRYKSKLGDYIKIQWFVSKPNQFNQIVAFAHIVQ